MEQPIDKLMNRLIAIELQWGLLCYLCYPSISIWWSRLWIIPNTLDLLFEAFVIWFSVSYTRYILSMHQIHLFVNSRLDSFQPSSHASNCVSEPKPSRRTPVKSNCHWPARLWPLLSSHYPGYSMKKLTSHHKGRRSIVSNQLLNFTTNCGAQKW